MNPRLLTSLSAAPMGSSVRDKSTSSCVRWRRYGRPRSRHENHIYLMRNVSVWAKRGAIVALIGLFIYGFDHWAFVPIAFGWVLRGIVAYVAWILASDA